jgi:hypothetical protein
MSPVQEDFFNILANPSVNVRIKKSIIQNSDSKLINKICELILNVLNKNISIPEATYKSLLPQAKYLRIILRKKLKLRDKKKILIKKGIQKGGFLQFIIPAVISAIGGIISSYISSKNKQNETGE